MNHHPKPAPRTSFNITNGRVANRNFHDDRNQFADRSGGGQSIYIGETIGGVSVAVIGRLANSAMKLRHAKCPLFPASLMAFLKFFG